MISLSFKTVLATALCILTFSSAAPTDGITKKGPSVIGLDFEVHRASQNTTLSKRQSINDNLINEQDFYLTYIQLGSNNQKIGVLVDTGSSDLWVPDVALSGKSGYYGFYLPVESTSANNLFELFYILYGDQSYARGTFYTDQLTIGGAVLQNFQFADATSGSATPAILGIGLESLEAPVAYGYGSQYTNLPFALKDAGYIDKVVYSLYLNSPKAKGGSLLFGGYDPAKISGPLVTLPHAGPLDRLDVTLDSLTVNGKVITVNSPFNLDSGTTFTYFPAAVYNAIVSDLGLSGKTYRDGTLSIPCSATGSINYSFHGITISTSIQDLIFEVPGGTCGLGVLKGDSILGDSFLAYAYLIYDLENSSVQIAQVKYTTESNIISL